MMTFKVTDLDSNSMSHISLGDVVKVHVEHNGDLRIIKNPIPGIKLSIRPLSNKVAVLVEEDEENLVVIDVLCLTNIGTLDAKTRESFRNHRQTTGMYVVPLTHLPHRIEPQIPEEYHSVFWAYHK